MTSTANHASTRRRVAGIVCDQWHWGKKPGRAASAAMLAATQPHQKAVCQKDHHRMTMKPVPQPPFIVIPAQLAFGLLVELFDIMPRMGMRTIVFSLTRGPR